MVVNSKVITHHHKAILHNKVILRHKDRIRYIISIFKILQKFWQVWQTYAPPGQQGYGGAPPVGNPWKILFKVGCCS